MPSAKKNEAKPADQQQKKGEAKPADQQQKKDASQKEEESTSTGSASGSGSGTSETASSSGSVAQQKEVAKDEKGERKPPQQPTDRAKNLKSVTLELSNGRRLYVDLRENERGMLINLAVVAGRLAFSRQGRVPRIVMPLEVAKQFIDFLGEIGPKLNVTQTPAAKTTTKEEEGTGEKDAPQGQTRGAAIHSATLTASEDREYQLSLLHSLYKGREPVLQISSTLGKRARRTMNIESGELAQLKATIEKLLRHADGQPDDDAGQGDHSERDKRDKKPAVAGKQELLGRQTVVFGKTRFFFDPFTMARGQSVRISNVYRRGMQVGRDSIVVPDKVLGAFAKILADYDTQMNGGNEKGEEGSCSSAASVSSSARSSASEGAKQQQKKAA